MEANEEEPTTRVNVNMNIPRGYQRSVSIRQNPDGTLSKVWTLRKFVHAEPTTMFNADQTTPSTNSEPQDEDISLQRSVPDSSSQLEDNTNIPYRSRLSKLRHQQRYPDPRKSESEQYNRSLRGRNLRRKYISMLQGQTPDENYYEIANPNEYVEDQSYLSKERLWGGNNEEEQACSYPITSTPVKSKCMRTPVRSYPRPQQDSVYCTANQVSPAAELMNDLLDVSNRQMMSPNDMSTSVNNSYYADANASFHRYETQAESMIEGCDAHGLNENHRYMPTAALIKRHNMEREYGAPRRLFESSQVESPAQPEIPVVSTLLCSAIDSAGIDGGPPFQVGMNIKCLPALVKLGKPHVDRAWNNPVMPGLIAAVQRVEDVYDGEILPEGDYDNRIMACERTPQRMGQNDRNSQRQSPQCAIGPSPNARQCPLGVTPIARPPQCEPQSCPLQPRTPPPSHCDNIPSSAPGRLNQPPVRRLSKQMTQTEANEILDELIEITVQGFNKLSEILKKGTDARCQLNSENKKSEKELEESLQRAENDLAEMRKSMQSTLMDIVQVIGKRSVLNVPEIREMVLNMQDERCGQPPKKNPKPTKEPEKESAPAASTTEENKPEDAPEDANPPASEGDGD